MGEGKSSDSVTWLARVQRVVLQNIGLKTFSLLVAIALFTVVHGSEAGQRSLHVPVVALLPPESSGKVLVGEIPDKVKQGLEIIPVSHVDEVLARALVQPLEAIEWTEADDLASQPVPAPPATSPPTATAH